MHLYFRLTFTLVFLISLVSCANLGISYGPKTAFYISENFYTFQPCGSLKEMQRDFSTDPNQAARARLGLEGYPYAIPPSVMNQVIEQHGENLTKALANRCM